MKKLSLLVLTFLIVACENNPYPTNGDIEENPRRETSPPREAIGVIIEPQYNLTEGVPKTIKIPATVPAPGKPVLELVNLPAGAKFDETKYEFSWTPSFSDGNDAKDPTIKTKDYVVGMYLRSSAGDIKAEYYEMLLTVMDSPQKFDIDGKSKATVYEGREFVYKFSIDNDDYPKGPFSVVTKNLPLGAKVKQVNDTDFEISFKADYQDVLLNRPNQCSAYRVNCIQENFELKVYNPAKHETSKEVTLEIRDTRLAPKLVVPETMTQGLDTSFQVSSYDLNGDIAPNIMISPDRMDFGDFHYTLSKNEELKSSVLNVSWRDIPPSYNGKMVKFDIRTCVYSESRNVSNCVDDVVRLKIVLKDRKAPIIERDQWPIGQIEYFKFDERKSFRIDAFDGDDKRKKVKSVEIIPADMKSYVSWRNGNLVARFRKPGIHQFSVVATSEYNMTTAQSFVAEVFDKNRSTTLYFTDTTRSSEVKFFKDIVRDVTLMNPVLQALNVRNLSGRDTLILGTDILMDKSLKTDIEMAMKKIPNILVASPLIENMPQKFLDELQKEHHISILGRYQNLSLPYAVKDLHFIARDDFEQSFEMVGLKTNTTTESLNPLIFSVGVDRVGCEDVLDLTDKSDEERLKIGIICDRKTGGRYAILGTEFADLSAKEIDKLIARKWLRRMLSTNLNGEIQYEN